MIAFDVRNFDAVTSTNHVLKQLMHEDAPEGVAVCALSQTGGYGRRGHVWESPQGGLYVSVLLRPDQHKGAQLALAPDAQKDQVAPIASLPSLSLVAGMAVRRAVLQLLSQAGAQADHVLLKWPNDVVVAAENCGAYKKLAGISLEGTARGLCLGIGVNVHPPASGPDTSKAYLCQLGFTGSVQDVCQAVLAAFAPMYEQWLTQPFSTFVSEYMAHNVMTGCLISATFEGHPVCGRFTGISPDGQLLLTADDDSVHAISSGEAHVTSITC